MLATTLSSASSFFFANCSILSILRFLINLHACHNLILRILILLCQLFNSLNSSLSHQPPCLPQPYPPHPHSSLPTVQFSQFFAFSSTSMLATTLSSASSFFFANCSILSILRFLLCSALSFFGCLGNNFILFKSLCFFGAALGFARIFLCTSSYLAFKSSGP